MDLSLADNSVKNWWNLPISNPKPDLHNINAHTKFSENPLILYLLNLLSRNHNTDGQTYDRRTQGQPMWYHNTLSLHVSCGGYNIIPLHYRVAGYKKQQQN